MDWHEEIKCVHVFRKGRAIEIYIVLEENFLKQIQAELGKYYMVFTIL